MSKLATDIEQSKRGVIMKYRVRHVDTSWLFFTPFSFLNMGGTDLYVLEYKKHWWNRWKRINSYSSEKYAYKKLNELKHKNNCL